MPRPSITLPDKLAEPMFCKEPDDFALMVLQIIKAACSSVQGNKELDEMLSFLSMSAKIICHEYMACVLSGTIEPYTFSPEFRNNEYDDFRKVILEAKAEVMKAGVPMVEKDGKYFLDVDKIRNKVEPRKEWSDDGQTES